MVKKSIKLSFRVSPAELERINLKRSEIGVKNMSAYLRKMVLDGYCVNLEMPELKEMTGLIGRCSNNLNQYAKRANETGSIYEADIEDVLVRLSEILDCQKKLLARMAVIK